MLKKKITDIAHQHVRIYLLAGKRTNKVIKEYIIQKVYEKRKIT